MSHKILIIEDEELIAEDLSHKLSRLGYNVIGHCANEEEALKLTRKHEPELFICDILLGIADYDGIDLMSTIYTFYKAPVIYLTASSESETVKRAMHTHPAAFLLKPFKISEFSINIDLAIQNFRSEVTFLEANKKLASDAIFLPDNYSYVKVLKKDILFVEADGGYIKVHTPQKKYSLSMNLIHFWNQLKDDSFIKVSRSHIINSAQVTRINGNMLCLQNKSTGISVSRSQRQDILKRFPILKTKGGL